MRCLLIAILSFLPCAIFAQDKIKVEPIIMLSLQDSSMDWWNYIPQEMSPYVQNINKTFRGEEFSIFNFVNVETENERTFKFSVKLISPNKEEKLIFENKEMSIKTAKGILFCPEFQKFSFGEQDDFGEYEFVLTVQVGDEFFSTSTKISLVDWINPESLTSAKDCIKAIYTFSYKPDAELLYSLFTSGKINLLQKGAPLELNHLVINFLVKAFDSMPFLYDKLLQEYSLASDIQKKKTVILFAMANRALSEEILAEAEVKEAYEYLRDNRLSDAYKSWDGDYSLAQLDSLMGEFYATAKYGTFKRILDALILTEEGQYAENLLNEKKAPKTSDEKNKYALGITYLSALNYVNENLKNDIFKNYLFKILSEKELPESVAMQLAVIIKTKNLNEKNPEEKVITLKNSSLEQMEKSK